MLRIKFDIIMEQRKQQILEWVEKEIIQPLNQKYFPRGIYPCNNGNADFGGVIYSQNLGRLIWSD